MSTAGRTGAVVPRAICGCGGAGGASCERWWGNASRLASATRPRLCRVVERSMRIGRRRPPQDWNAWSPTGTVLRTVLPLKQLPAPAGPASARSARPEPAGGGGRGAGGVAGREGGRGGGLGVGGRAAVGGRDAQAGQRPVAQLGG